MSLVKEFAASISNFDIIAFLFFILMGVRGAFIGFIDAVMNTLSLVVSIVAAFLLCGVVSTIFASAGLTFFPKVVAFIAVFLLVYIGVKVAQYFISKLTNFEAVGKLNRFLGFLLGVLEGVVIVVLVVIICDFLLFRLLKISSLFEGSVIVKLIKEFVLPLLQ